MNPIIAALLTLPARPIPGAALLARLHETVPTEEELLEAGPEIERELNRANQLAQRSKKAVDRCLQLKPVSTPKPPHGF